MSKLFFGGIPTGMDVDKLIREIETVSGTSIAYAAVEQLLGLDHRKDPNRFRTVTGAWRKRLFREKFLQSTASDGHFHFLTADEAHDHGRMTLSKIGRAAGRMRLRVEAVNANELTGERRDKHNLLRRESLALVDAATRSVKAIAAPKPANGAPLRLAAKN